MQQRRCESLEFLKTELNANTYMVRQMEFGAELSDIYGDLYELEVQKTKKNATMMNSTAAKCIENAHIFTAIVYKKEDLEDKFEYLSSMLNLELSAASKLTKFITSDLTELIDKTR